MTICLSLQCILFFPALCNLSETLVALYALSCIGIILLSSLILYRLTDYLCIAVPFLYIVYALYSGSINIMSAAYEILIIDRIIPTALNIFSQDFESRSIDFILQKAQSAEQ